MTAPRVADPPITDDWMRGWEACREVLSAETDDAYERGLRARPVTPRLDPLLLAAAFILGMLLAAAINAAAV